MMKSGLKRSRNWKTLAKLWQQNEVSQDDFTTRVLGGAWLMKTKGIPFDAVQGSVRGQLAKDFCERRSMQKAIGFEYTAYGGDRCSILARAWCHRMQWLFNQELSLLVKPGQEFSEEHLKSYDEPSEFRRLAESASGKLSGRVSQIRAIH